MGEMSPWHWAVVIAVAVLLFGARRLPDAARSLGRSARILRAELNDEPAGAASPDAGPTPSGTGSDHPAEHPRRAEGPTGT